MVIEVVGAVAKEETNMLSLASNLSEEFNSNALVKSNAANIKSYVYEPTMESFTRVVTTDFLKSAEQYVYITLPEYLGDLKRMLRKTAGNRHDSGEGSSCRKPYVDYGSNTLERVAYHKLNREVGGDYSRGGKRRAQWNQGETLQAYAEWQGNNFNSWAEEHSSIMKGNLPTVHRVPRHQLTKNLQCPFHSIVISKQIKTKIIC